MLVGVMSMPSYPAWAQRRLKLPVLLRFMCERLRRSREPIARTAIDRYINHGQNSGQIFQKLVTHGNASSL